LLAERTATSFGSPEPQRPVEVETFFSCYEMAKWLREIFVSLGVAAITLVVFAMAIGFGVVVAIKLTNGSFWVGAAAAFGFLILVVLPLRLLWVTGRQRTALAIRDTTRLA
jgi:hypothetical protein